jgi:hypothetical protein
MQLSRKNKLAILTFLLVNSSSLLFAGDKRLHSYGSTNGKDLYQELPDLDLYKNKPIIAQCPKNSGARVTVRNRDGTYNSFKPTYLGHKEKYNEDLPVTVRHAEWWFAPIVKTNIKTDLPLIAECHELINGVYVPTVDIDIPSHVEFCYETPEDKNKKVQFYCK